MSAEDLGTTSSFFVEPSAIDGADFTTCGSSIAGYVVNSDCRKRKPQAERWIRNHEPRGTTYFRLLAAASGGTNVSARRTAGSSDRGQPVALSRALHVR